MPYPKGLKLTEESRKKMSEARKLLWQNPEYRLKNKTSTGFKPTEEHIQNIKKAQLGKKLSQKIKDSISKRMSGENSPSKRPDVRKKMSESRKGMISPMKGKKHTEESKLKNRNAKLGKKRSGNPSNWKHTQETIEKIIYSKLLNNSTKNGKDHYKWINDRNLLKKYEGNEIRRSSIYKQWRRSCCNRDNWKCKINNDECTGRLEVHHILSFTKHPELRYDINNGITLCKFHHPRKRGDETKMVSTFQELILLSLS